MNEISRLNTPALRAYLVYAPGVSAASVPPPVAESSAPARGDSAEISPLIQAAPAILAATPLAPPAPVIAVPLAKQFHDTLASASTSLLDSSGYLTSAEAPSISRMGEVAHTIRPAELTEILTGPRPDAVANQYYGLARAEFPTLRASEHRQMALAMFEKDLSRVDTAVTVKPFVADKASDLTVKAGIALPKVMKGQSRASELASSAIYTGTLAACLAGCPATLTPAVMLALQGFTGPDFLKPGPDKLVFTNPKIASGVAETLRVHEFGHIEVCGGWNSEQEKQVARVAEEIFEKMPALRGIIKTVNLQTFIRADFNHDGEYLYSAAGLASPQLPSKVTLSRTELSDPLALKILLSHEMAHQWDLAAGNGQAFGSQSSQTPFGKTRSREDYVNDYAFESSPGIPHPRGSETTEDLAETLCITLRDWDKIHKESDLFLYADGKKGEKRRWILEHTGAQVPPPGKTWLSIVEAASAPGSPFSGDVGCQLSRFLSPIGRGICPGQETGQAPVQDTGPAV